MLDLTADRLRLRIGVDSGGTFTDICMFDEIKGEISVWKVSSTPQAPSMGITVEQGLREASRVSGRAADVHYFGHGTTVATNALIVGRGAETGLITTAGFRDILELRRQKRDSLYYLQTEKPKPIASRDRCFEVDERVLLPIEALETEHPVMVECYEFVQDSGGPGKFRGGMTMRRRVRVLDHVANISAGGTNTRLPPYGLFNGHSGTPAWVEMPNGAPPLDRRKSVLQAGQAVGMVAAGGGGFGDPKLRSRELVIRDLKEERISEAAARDIYGLDI
ncbi:hydantoinase/oxoprolinase N-terminal domain-containing protein [Pseudomonas sp. PD9R]|uniref:hydantoinase/oxoprolinase N-terminal domain-containing protein n=1 Tax=Pseudomonas sp. PD9R TaxID=2853534 RepID=UPI001C4954FE|nr:hydantoinase/oxoprolinase N-terminal domain-containing protein [Pseudomonas sp. PD9R]MBV6826505.1 hydantoinase B/oxoprolinase family protein [Pseudomonas sp. PD9R]